MNAKDEPVCADRTKRKLYTTAYVNHNFRRVSSVQDPQFLKEKSYCCLRYTRKQKQYPGFSIPFPIVTNREEKREEKKKKKRKKKEKKRKKRGKKKKKKEKKEKKRGKKSSRKSIQNWVILIKLITLQFFF